MPKKSISSLKQKSEHLHWILHIQISQTTKFQLKNTILIFWTKFAQKQCYQLKTEKVSITNECCIFKLVTEEKTTTEFGEPEIQKTRNSLFWKNLILARHQELQLNSLNPKYEISTSPFIYANELKRSKFYFNLTEYITAAFLIYLSNFT